jgi:hypothetical protein
MLASTPGLPSPASFRSPRIIATVLVCTILSTSALAQPAGPNYTADMPSVERVKAEIKGSDANDTLARQVAVFVYLSAYIQRIKYNRTVRGPYTPEEQKAMGAYDLASYQISQDYAKSHTPAEAQAFERLHGQYEMNGEFQKDWTKRLMGPQSTAAYKSAVTQLGVRQAEHVEGIKRANEEAVRASNTPADRTTDPTAVATRRCLELGGTSVACLGKGMGAGFMDMIGINLKELTGPGKAGLVLSGQFHNPSAVTALNFTTDTVTIAGCGKLVEDPHLYNIAKGPNALIVTVDNEPRPLVMPIRPDGGLAGPGVVDVKGRVITGYHIETSTLYINGQPAVGGSCGGVCTTSTRVPDYAPKIERCTIGPLNAPPPLPPETTSKGTDAGLVGLLLGSLETFAPPAVPGLRMTGQFSSGALKLDFTENSVTLDCGQAHVRQPYTVENAPAESRVHVQNAGGPFTLTLLPNRTLRGSGSTTVNGRLVTGMQGDNVTFAPHSERCEIGSFVQPQTVPASPGSATAASAASATAPAASPTPSLIPPGSALLRVSTNFPKGPNPLTGKAVFLYKDSLVNVLRKAGASVAPGATSGLAFRDAMKSCQPPANCNAVSAAMEPFIAGRALIDIDGRALIIPPVPPGRYYVSASTQNGNAVLVWDIKVDLKAGDNSIVLDPNTAETIR